VAAGAVIVQEAGGTVTDFEGKDNFIFGERFVCGAPGAHRGLLEKIKLYF